MRLSRRGVITLGLAAILAACRAAAPSPGLDPGARPIVLLVGIDGWRWDYLDRYPAPAIAALAADGVRAEGLIPQFPSKTFPNHYTLVTGLRLARHGIVSNNMRDPDIPGQFTLSNRQVQEDPRWWGGEPIWNTLERQGGLAAPMFWPGSEVEIGGRRPTYWIPFDDDMPHRERVARILGWLKRPEAERPSFLTLYYSDVDTAGHDFGPDAEETRDAIARVDRSVGELVAGVRALGLADRVNYVLASDHGMSALSPDRTIVLDDYLDVGSVDVVDWAPVLGVSARDGDVERIYRALRGKHPHLAVYRRDEIPAEYGIAGHRRIADVVGIADDGWYITSRRNVDRWEHGGGRAPGGTHGYAAGTRSMQGLFIASGPRFRRGVVVPPFENIHVYDLLCAALGITAAANDGDPAVTRDMLR